MLCLESSIYEGGDSEAKICAHKAMDEDHSTSSMRQEIRRIETGHVHRDLGLRTIVIAKNIKTSRLHATIIGITCFFP